MRVLALDSTATDCRVALFDNGTLLSLKIGHGARQQTENLIPMVLDILDEVGIKQPDRIAVAAGPGSFTGIRIGLAAAQGLARGWGCPCIAVDRFSMLGATEAVRTSQPPVAIILDSLRAELFAQLWFHGHATGPVLMATPAELIPQLEQQAQAHAGATTFAVTGDGTAHIKAFSSSPITELTIGHDDLQILASIISGTKSVPQAFYIRSPDVTLRT